MVYIKNQPTLTLLLKPFTYKLYFSKGLCGEERREGILEWVWVIRFGEGGWWWLSWPGAESLGPLRWAERRPAPVIQPGDGDDLGLKEHGRGPVAWVQWSPFTDS